MNVNPEERKEYNKTYYTTNMYKDVILKKALKKVECQFCQKVVIYNNIYKHQQTKLCQRLQQKNILIKQRNALETFNELSE